MRSIASSQEPGILQVGKSKPASLRILPESASLRGKASPFLESQQWADAASDETPRALRGLAQIVDGGLCHRCGSCVGICPTGVLAFDKEEYPKVQNLSACTDCDLCVKVCPGDEFPYHDMHHKVFQTPGNLEETHGHFEEAVLAHSTEQEVRSRSTSGGLVTGLLLHLLETQQIDGAVVISSSSEDLWKGRPIIARTREQLLSSMKSKYAISPANSCFAEIRALEGRYALVGLPCHIHGFRKAAELDERIKQRVVLTIGLFCHAAIEHDAFRIIWESLGEKTQGVKSFVSRIGKHPGTPHIEMKNGEFFPVYFGSKKGYRPTSIEMINVLYRLYTPARCLTCYDALAEFADISVGDPWMAPSEDDIQFHDGWSFALLRSAAGKQALESSVQAGSIVARHVTRKEALGCNNHMSAEKRWRAFRVIETQRRQGKSIPAYGGGHHESFPRHSGFQFIKTEINIFTHAFCFLPAWRAPVLRFFLGNGGYWILWLNNKRRRLKVWLRDRRASLRRRFFGRQ